MKQNTVGMLKVMKIKNKSLKHKKHQSKDSNSDSDKPNIQKIKKGVMVDQLDNCNEMMLKPVSKPMKFKHVCGMCQKRFSTRENLDKHIDAAHQLC